MQNKSIHGIMRDASEIAQAISVVSSSKHVPPKFKKYLHKYYHIECTADEYIQLASKDEETITHQGVIYKIIVLDFDRLYSYMKLSLSFRQTKHILNCDNFCVVSIATKE